MMIEIAKIPIHLLKHRDYITKKSLFLSPFYQVTKTNGIATPIFQGFIAQLNLELPNLSAFCAKLASASHRSS